MYSRILLCYDGSAEGRNALREGADIALCMKAETFLLAICRNIEPTVPEGATETLFRCNEDNAKAVLNEGVEWLKGRGLEAHGLLMQGDPLVHIAATAQRLRADLIVVGHRKRGRLERWWS